MKYLVILVLCSPLFAFAKMDVENFDQAQNGKSKVDFSINYEGSSFTKSEVATPSTKVETTGSSTNILLDYGYGVSEDMALHLTLGYLTASSEDKVNADATQNQDIDISGMTDALLQVLGTHGDAGSVWHWGILINYGLGDVVSKEKSVGPPAKFENNAYSGRTTLSAKLGYAQDIGYGNLGVLAQADVLKKDATLRYTSVALGEQHLEIDGGQETHLEVFYELLAEKILWGTSLGYTQVQKGKIRLNSAVVDHELPESYYNFSVYSRLDTGAGQELVASFGYDIYGESGGLPSNYKLEDGSVFSLSVGYSIEF